MTTDDVAERLRVFVSQRFGVPDTDKDFTIDVDLYSYGYVDSFGGLELNHFVEQEFDIRLTDDELAAAPLSTIRQIASFVSAKRRQEV